MFGGYTPPMRTLWLLALLGCSTPTDDPDDTDDGDTDDSGGDTGPIEDADDPEHAVELLLEDPRGDTLYDADEDWWKVAGTAGQHFRIQVVNDDEKASDDSLDTVVEVFDAALTRIAWEDDHPVGDVSVYDTVCFGFFPADGDYYVRVTDQGVFDGSPRTVETTGYEVTFLTPSSVPDEPDSLLAIDLEYGMDTPNSWYAIPVRAEEAGDVDYIKLLLGHTDGTLAVYAAGHIESSPYAPAVEVYDDEATLVLSAGAVGGDHLAQLAAPMGIQYELAVRDTSGSAGDHVGMWLFAANYEEGFGYTREVEPNNDAAGAETIPLYDQEPDAGSWFAGGVEGRMGGMEDADAYTFTTTEDAYLEVAFGSLYYGGLLHGDIELVHDGAIIARAASDGVVDPSLVTDTKVPAGDYTLTVRSVDPTALGEGYFYRLVVHATSVPR